MIPYRLIAAALIVLALGLALLGYGHRQFNKGQQVQRTVDQAAADKLKAEAAATLARLTAQVRTREDLLQTIVNKAEVKREQSQAENSAALRTAVAGPRLQFVAEGCGRGSSSPGTATATSSAASDAASAVVQLPEPINRDLLQFAADAQSLAIDYGVLFAFVNDLKLVCEVR